MDKSTEPGLSFPIILIFIILGLLIYIMFSINISSQQKTPEDLYISKYGITTLVSEERRFPETNWRVVYCSKGVVVTKILQELDDKNITDYRIVACTGSSFAIFYKDVIHGSTIEVTSPITILN